MAAQKPFEDFLAIIQTNPLCLLKFILVRRHPAAAYLQRIQSDRVGWGGVLRNEGLALYYSVYLMTRREDFLYNINGSGQLRISESIQLMAHSTESLPVSVYFKPLSLFGIQDPSKYERPQTPIL